jgi:hypothetical protein
MRENPGLHPGPIIPSITQTARREATYTDVLAAPAHVPNEILFQHHLAARVDGVPLLCFHSGGRQLVRQLV